MERSVERLTAYDSLINDVSRLATGDLAEHCQAIRDEYNKSQVFDISGQHSNLILPERYARYREDLGPAFLAALLQDVKFENFEYQFLRAQFFSAVVEFYYLKDMDVALQRNDPGMIADYARFKPRGLLYTMFPKLGYLTRDAVL